MCVWLLCPGPTAPNLPLGSRLMFGPPDLAGFSSMPGCKARGRGSHAIALGRGQWELGRLP